MVLEIYSAKGDQNYYLSGYIYPMATVRPMKKYPSKTSRRRHSVAGGTIQFNKKAVEKYSLAPFTFMEIYLDEEKNRVYFKFLNEITEHSYKFSVARTGFHCSPKSLIRRLKIKKTTRYEVFGDEENKMIFIDLTKPRRMHKRRQYVESNLIPDKALSSHSKPDAGVEG